jgi:hypothetical protein
LKKLSLPFIAFLQAAGLMLYIILVGTIVLHGDQWFGKMANLFGPILFLTLFSTSALICGLITFSYPFLLFWEHKEPREALRLIFYTTLWLAVFVFTALAAIAYY